MSMHKMYTKHRLELSVINAAAHGDSDAMDIVLRYYAGYIKKLSTMKTYDEYGNSILYCNEDLRGELELHAVYTTAKCRLSTKKDILYRF